MTTKTKIFVGVSLIAVGTAVTLFVTRGGNTLPGRVAVATAQKLIADTAKPLATPSSTEVRARTAAGMTAAIAASHAPLPPQNVPIAAYLEDLKRRAKTGEVGAACRVTFELARCGMRAGLRRLATDLQEQLANDGLSQHAREIRERQIAELEGQAASLDATCKNVPDLSPADLWEYALIAAYGGNVKTMVHFAAAPPGLDSRNLLGQLEGWTAWRENAGNLVTRAVEAGDPAAVELAGHMHMVPRMGYQVLPLDPVRGLAHYYALEHFASPAYRTMLNNSIASFSERFNVTEAQRQQAMALSVEIGAKISRGGQAVDGVDFRRGSGTFKDALHCE